MSTMIPCLKKSLAALSLALVLAGCASEPEGYEQVDAATAAAIIAEEENEIILDVRTPEEYAEAHIPGAINIPNEEIGTDPIAALPDKDQPILIYCRSGNRSKQAAAKLADQGYTHIIEFGGIRDWPGDPESAS